MSGPVKIKKSDFGKGIRALLTNIDTEVRENPERVVKEFTNNSAMLPIQYIEVNPFQPRKDFDPIALEELSASITAYGLIQPITVRRLNDTAFQLISGERRFRASKLAGLTEVPVYIRVAENDQEMLEMALVENIQREDLNAIEVAISYQRLIDECNMTHDNMSVRVGKKRSTITNYLRLLKLPGEIQTAIKNKLLSMGHARALAGVNDLGLQLMLFHQTIKEGLSVRDVENLIQSYTEGKKTDDKKAAPKLSAEYRAVQDTLSSFFGTKIQLKAKGDGKGSITINFNSDDELNRILDNCEKNPN
jgi:ParB family transcriptional regulator, chromosome partitioning protein